MHPTNKTKLSVGLIIIVLFTIGLFSGVGKNVKLLAPTPAFAQIGPGASTNPASPVIIQSQTPTLFLAAFVPSIDCYKYRLRDVGAAPNYTISGATQPAYISSCVNTSSPLPSNPNVTAPSHQVTKALNIEQLYAFDAQSCIRIVDAKKNETERCSEFSKKPIYFIIKTKAPPLELFAEADGITYQYDAVTDTWKPVEAPIALPELFAETDGQTLRYNPTTGVWESISEAPAVMPDLFAEADGRLYKFDGTKWTQISGPKTVVGEAVQAVGNAVKNVRNVVVDFFQRIVGRKPTPLPPPSGCYTCEIKTELGTTTTTQQTYPIGQQPSNCNSKPDYTGECEGAGGIPGL